MGREEKYRRGGAGRQDVTGHSPAVSVQSVWGLETGNAVAVTRNLFAAILDRIARLAIPRANFHAGFEHNHRVHETTKRRAAASA